MFEKLKKKHMVKSIFGCLVLWAIAGVILGLNLESVKVFFDEPVALEDLKASDLHANLKVNAEIYLVMDYYSYTEEDGRTVTMEFMIPVGDEEYMGLECSYSTMDKAKENMELYWDYMDGEDVSLDDMKVIPVKGTIQPLKGDSLRYFNEFVDALGWTEEEEEIFVPYVLKVDNIGELDDFTALFLALIFLVLFFVGLGVLISGMRGSNLKALEKYCASKGNKEYEMQKIEQFYQMGTPVQGIRAGSDYFMAVSGTQINFAPADKLLWAYTHVVQHRTNFIPTGKTFSIIVKLSDGSQLSLPMDNQAACDQALNYIATNYPYLYIGYDDQFNRMFNKNRDEMIRLVRGRMGQQGMEQADMLQQDMPQQDMEQPDMPQM